MAPRWRRFFEELYRRTGALEDNINAAAFGVDADSGFTGAIAITGNAPTIIHNRVAAPSTVTGTITITESTPTPVEA
jgi:hypothetical protein